MLSSQRNKLLCETGPGTQMGELLRRYWQPIAGVSEFERQDTKAVRIMGEDLVLYRDREGNYGLVDRHCPHRRADLAYGFTEDRGLRCNYHGWLYGADADLLRQTAAQLRDQLTETEFRSCIAKGEELDGAQVIDLALDAIARAAAKPCC